MTALQQSPEFARALTAYGADIASVAPVILRRRFARYGRVMFASRAVPSDIADTPVQILNGETPCKRPYRAAGFRQIMTPAHIAQLDLTRDDLRAGMSGKWRNRLVKAERHGVRIRETTWDGSAHPMFAAAKTLARKRRYGTYPTALLSTFAQINPNDALLFEAYDRGTLCAACLVLRHGQTATYQTAWSTPTGHALQAPRAVLWAAAKRLAALGHEDFDLGTVDTDHAAGLARFKLGSGAALRPLGGTWVRLRAP
ncbi:GNAT family N-acetyltransferase [Octadecabacter sp. 1_MG-2023]|uniref:GNAT family N-acetyltransferase n=1 Tax=unclassified Octadecabacter TaxID=196158 RepID=UPI0020905524|nr:MULTISPECIES: GNAT family N-acetyltransferase [unclassified Octadecabacter]MDO6733124.1 GNAT family N-acetyltransferase [Octadecabacter sp. 1_MG-2023]